MFQTCIKKYGSAIRKLVEGTAFSESQMVLRVNFTSLQKRKLSGLRSLKLSKKDRRRCS